MNNRVRQFIVAARAKLTANDFAYVKRILPDAEAYELFCGMSVIDMRHALNTARTAEIFAAQSPEVDKKLLLRAALLHDVGRKKGDMGLWAKVFAVLATRFFPCRAKKMAEQYAAVVKNNNDAAMPHISATDDKTLRSRKGYGAFCFHRILYIYYFHAAIGAAKLRTLALTDEARLVAAHHDLPQDSDSPELKLLRLADELN